MTMTGLGRRQQLFDDRFDILLAVRRGYVFIWQERAYLGALLVMPMLLHILTFYYVTMQGDGMSTIQSTLWSLPASLLSGWFFFAQSRMILFKERATDIAKAPVEKLKNRGRLMQASILTWLLFVMAMSALTAIMEWTLGLQTQGHGGFAMGLGVFAIGAMTWALRFSVAHIVVAAGLPLRLFVFAVNGVGFSLRLVALGFLAAFPVLFFFLPVLGYIAGPQIEQGGLSPATIFLGCAMSMIIKAILNAAATYALADIFFKDKRRET